MNAFKLYELGDQYNQVAEMLENGIDGLEDTLEALEDSFQDKVESIIKLMRTKIAERNAIDEEKQRLDKRAKALDKQVDSLENYVEQQMIKTKMKKVPSTLFSITISDNPPKVEVFAENWIPQQYMRVSTASAPDKMAIKEAIQRGEEVPGAKIVQTQSLRVR